MDMLEKLVLIEALSGVAKQMQHTVNEPKTSNAAKQVLLPLITAINGAVTGLATM